MRSGDAQLLRAAARRIALQITAAVAASMLLLIAVVAGLVVRAQQAATDGLLASAAASAEDVDDPPAGAWIVLGAGSNTESSPGLPVALQAPLAQLRRPPFTAGRTTTLSVGTRTYRVRTVSRRGRQVQVAVDLEPQDRERSRLLGVLTATAALSLLLAALIGRLLGRRAVAPVAEALRLQRTFVADASHELRTPLTLLSTRAQVLLRELGTATVSPSAVRDAEGVVTDAQRLAGVVDDLLVAAIPGGEERVQVDLRQLAREVVEAAQAHAASTGVVLNGPQDSEPSPMVLGAEAALRRAVLALVDNAVDHTPAGRSVTVSVGVDRRHAVVSVADEGPGLKRDAAQRVFRRFHSGGQRAGRAHYGLGLALTQDVADRHGGRVRLADVESGAQFDLVLPLLRPGRRPRRL